MATPSLHDSRKAVSSSAENRIKTTKKPAKIATQTERTAAASWRSRHRWIWTKICS